MSTPTTTAPNVAPTTLRPPSTPRSTTCLGEASTHWDPGGLCPSMALDLASTSPPPPPTRTLSPANRSTPAPPSTGHHVASAPRTSCLHWGRATHCPACPRTNNTSTTKPWWIPAGAPTLRPSAGTFRDESGPWIFISRGELIKKTMKDEEIITQSGDTRDQINSMQEKKCLMFNKCQGQNKISLRFQVSCKLEALH